MSFLEKAKKVWAEIQEEEAREKRLISEIRPLPFLDRDGSVVIPFGADSRYHYWTGGQSIEDTEREVRQWVH